MLIAPRVFTNESTAATTTTTLIASQSLSTVEWKYNSSSTATPPVDVWNYSYPTSSGSAWAFACESAFVSWTRAVEASRHAGFTTTVYPTFTSTTSWVIPFADIYTSCNGVFRAHGKARDSSTTTYRTGTTTSYTETVWSISEVGAPPPCFVDRPDCGYLHSSFAIENSSFALFEQSYTSPVYFTSAPVTPHCSLPVSMPPKSTSNCGKCSLWGDHVQLMYWPVTMTGGDVCGNPGTTVTTNYSTSRTAVVDGITMVSPSVYISFNKLWAADFCGRTLGEPISSTVLALPPDQLSSARGDHWSRRPYSFNYADLNGNVSKEAYCQMVRYDWLPCQTVYDDDYEPYLWIPAQVASMRPEWNGCDQGIHGITDPPHALTSQLFLTTPTPVIVTTTDPVAPAPGPTTKVVPETETTRTAKTVHHEETQTGSLHVDDPPQATKSAPKSAHHSNSGHDSKVHHEETQTGSLHADGPPQATQSVPPSAQQDNSGHDDSDRDSSDHNNSDHDNSQQDPPRVTQNPAIQIGHILTDSKDPTSLGNAQKQTQGGGVASAIASVLGLTQQSLPRMKPGAVIGSQTLDSARGTAIDGGATFSVDLSGNLIVGSSTLMPISELRGPLALTAGASGAPYIVLASSVTLTVGGSAKTINGSVYSAGSSGLVVNGSTTIAYATATSVANSAGSHTAAAISASITASPTGVVPKLTGNGSTAEPQGPVSSNAGFYCFHRGAVSRLYLLLSFLFALV